MAQRTLRHILLCACWLGLSWHAYGQAYNTADYVKNLYSKYLNRQPTSNELTQWVWSFQKGLSLHEAQVTFLSSDEYFRRYARDSSAFISGLFTDVLGRAPSPRESLQWLHSLNVSGDDRTKIIRDFLKVTESHVSDSSVPLADGVGGWKDESTGDGQTDDGAHDEGADTSDGNGSGDERGDGEPAPHLLATAGLLHDAIDRELGGTRQGRQLAIMSRNLMDATRNLEQAKRDARALYQQASQDVRAALNAVDQKMGQLYYSARTSNTYLDRFKRILGSAAEETAVMKPLPMTQLPTVGSIGAELYNSYVPLSRALLGDAKQVIDMLEYSAAENLNDSQLLREVQFFRSQANSVQQSLRSGMLEDDLRHEILRLRALSLGITQLMQESGQVGLVVQRWEIVLDDLKQMGELVGVSSGSAIDPGQPLLINSPTYHHMPYQVQRPTREELSNRALPKVDQAIAHIDAFVAGFNRFLHLSPRVPALQSRARRLRVQLAQFRENLAGEADPSKLKARVKEMEQSLETLKSLFQRTVQERWLANTPDLEGISAAITRLTNIFDVDDEAAAR